MARTSVDGLNIRWFYCRLRKMEVIQLLYRHRILYDYSKTVDQLKSALAKAVRNQVITREEVKNKYYDRPIVDTVSNKQ